MGEITSTWYTQLVEECRAIVVEHEFSSRIILIEGYHALGKRIIEDPNFTPDYVRRIARDIQKSERTVQRAIQFYKKYPDLQRIPYGKNVSWHMICNNLLPEPRAEVVCTHEPIVICRKCRVEMPGVRLIP